MMRAIGTINGDAAIILGLSAKNLTRLVAGDPITFDARQLGFNGTIRIIFGRDEETMKNMVLAHNPDVTVHQMPNETQGNHT